MMQNQKRENRNISIFYLFGTGWGSAAFYFTLLSDQHTNPYIIECGFVCVCIDNHHHHNHHMCTWYDQLLKEFVCYPVHRHLYSIPFFMVFYVCRVNGAFFMPFSFDMWILFVYYLCLFVVISSIIATRFIPSLFISIVRYSTIWTAPSLLLLHLPAFLPFIRFHIGISPFDYYRFSEYCRVVPFYFLFVIR